MMLRGKGSRAEVSVLLSRPLFLIGSDPKVDLHLPDVSIPGVAVKIERSDSNYSVENVGKSKNIKLNGKTLKHSPLQMGDELSIDGASFCLESPAQESSATPTDHNGSTIQLEGLEEELGQFALEVAKERDLKRLLEKVLQSVRTRLDADEAFVFTLDSKKEPKVTASHGIRDLQRHFSQSIVTKVLQENQGLVLENALADKRFVDSESIVDLHLKSVICAPICVAGETVGIIYLASSQASSSYQQADLRLVSIYSLIVGMLIQHVDFITQQNRILDRMAAQNLQSEVVATSPVMQKVMNELQAVAPSDISVCLQGETGTGKEVMAEWIHKQSERKEGPFVAVNCSSLRGELLESELFGYKKGAFTGAVQDRKGLFAAANGGTLFLDEMGEMESTLQSKLLRALESGKIRRVGSLQEEVVEVRVICATNRDLADMVQKEEFRRDLYYRLAQVVVTLPPLRARGDDILILAHQLLDRFQRKYPHKQVRDFHPESLQKLLLHNWPGNIRELVNLVHKSVLMASGPLVLVSFDESSNSLVGLEEATKQFQKEYIQRTLSLCEGNKEKSAQVLGMSRSTFFRYVSQLGSSEVRNSSSSVQHLGKAS